MPKKGKKKSDEPSEPQHKQAWEQAVDNEKWLLPPDELPNSMEWPTWGALRERILTSCTEIIVNAFSVPDEVPKEEREGWPARMVTVTDAFFAEVVKLSPPYLSKMAFVGCSNLRSVVLSPMGACPSLNKLDLSQCSNLSFVLIQSESLDTLNLSLCGSLTKILLHCKSLANLDLRECLNLESIIIWSDVLDTFEIPECRKVKVLELHCPSLPNYRVGRQILAPKATSVKHGPVSIMESDTYSKRLGKEVKEQDTFFKGAIGSEAVPKTFRTM